MTLEEITPSQGEVGETADLATEDELPEPEDFQERPENLEGETPDDTDGPEVKTGERETNDEEENGDEVPAETKLVVHIQDGRVGAAVWRTGADPHIETLPGCRELEDALSALPNVIERAKAHWAESPMRPKYSPPKAQRKKQGDREKRQKPPEPDQHEPEPEAGQPQQQTGMTRLF